MPERCPQHLLLWCVGQVFLCTHHIGDVHFNIIDHVGKKKHGAAIASQENKIFNGLIGKVHTAAHEVFNNGVAFWHTKTQYSARTGL